MTPRVQFVQPTAAQRERVAREDARSMLACGLRTMLHPDRIAVSISVETLMEIIDALEDTE